MDMAACGIRSFTDYTAQTGGRTALKFATLLFTSIHALLNQLLVNKLISRHLKDSVLLAGERVLFTHAFVTHEPSLSTRLTSAAHQTDPSSAVSILSMYPPRNPKSFSKINH